MSKNTITVSGKCGSGKTSIASYIKQALEGRGFTNISIHDPDVIFETDYPHLQEKRLSAILDSPIIIETINTPYRE